MRRVGIVLAAMVGVVALAMPSAQADPSVSVCVTVTEKAVSLNINGTQIGSPPVSAPPTCIQL